MKTAELKNGHQNIHKRNKLYGIINPIHWDHVQLKTLALVDVS